MNCRLASLWVASLLALVLLGGCSKSLFLTPTPNQPPTVRLTSGPVDTNEVCRPRPGISCYSLLLHWVGFDPDGRVASYLYAVDPPDQGDTTWIQTTEKEKRFVFEVTGGSTGRDSLTLMQGYHVVVVRAVDNRGATSSPAYRAFFSWTTAPTVQIVNPRPRRNSPWFLPTSVRFTWQGYDDDATSAGKRPVQYKYLLLGPGNDESVIPGGIQAIIASGGSLIRRYYAPQFRAEDGWVTVSGDTVSVQFTDLVPGSSYLFMVAAFDESGAYSPVFQLTTNVLYFTVGYATAFGPTMAVFNDTFYYKYPGPGFNPAAEVRVDVPGGRPFSISWSATPPPGADIVAYRWMVDGDVFDQHSRTDEMTDLRHWSTPSANVTTATIGPFPPGDHFFYAQAEDNTGLKALATVHFSCVEATFTRPLLIVDDTRRPPDSFRADGSLQTTTNSWPAAAELDTFLYAVGGVPWRRATRGMLSPQGILAGYDFDTLGTRVASADGALPLATLAQYRHVVWLEDFESARNARSFTYPIEPMTLLTYMTTPGKVNTLTAYIQLGGEVWMVGGGGAMATLNKFNSLSNDPQYGSIIFNSAANELVPGRFMYNVAHWRSQILEQYNLTVDPTRNAVRLLGRFSSRPGVYAGLPETFDARTSVTDPLPPLSSGFYPRIHMCEFLNVSNRVVEQVVGDPSVDFAIDSFDDVDSSAVPGRWRSSDAINTTVVTVEVPSGSEGAARRALRVRTQGGGASDGDQVQHQFGGTRDYSGLTAIHMSVREDPAGHVAAWRVRLFDADGHTVSAPIPATGLPGAFAALDITDATFALDPASPPGFDHLHVTGVGLELERGDVAATTDFDDLRAVTQPSASVLDTLLAIRTGYGANEFLGPTMTVYHGHDLPRPFIFTGFAPWMFRRTQCQQLFDFVLNGLWGLPRSTGSSNVDVRRSAAAAGRAPRSAPTAQPAPSARAVRRR